MLDPAADKLLLATSFVVLAVMHLVPLWLMATAVARDLIIVSGAIAYRLWLGPVEARPSNLSKLNTLCQALFILCVIARQQFSQPDAWAIVTLGALTFLTTVVSGIDYVLRYGKAALEESQIPAHAPSTNSHEAARARRDAARQCPVRQFLPGAERGSARRAAGSRHRSDLVVGKSRVAARAICCKPVCAATDGPAAYIPLASISSGRRCLPRRCADSRTAAWCAWMTSMPWRAISTGSKRCFACSTRLRNRAHGSSSRRDAAPPRGSSGGSTTGARGRQLAWSITCSELDEAGRARALELRAAQRGLKLPAETLDYLMKRMPRDLRSLFEILDELDEASLAAQRRLTIPFIREALEKHADTKP